jgi:hypothetical protein
MAINSLIPLTRTELDVARCSNPQCTEDHGPLYFHGLCHPDAQTMVSYENGVLRIDCGRCEARIATVSVSAGHTAPLRADG